MTKIEKRQLSIEDRLVVKEDIALM